MKYPARVKLFNNVVPIQLVNHYTITEATRGQMTKNISTYITAPVDLRRTFTPKFGSLVNCISYKASVSFSGFFSGRVVFTGTSKRGVSGKNW